MQGYLWADYLMEEPRDLKAIAVHTEIDRALPHATVFLSLQY